jgi:hypothetical protein
MLTLLLGAGAEIAGLMVLMSVVSTLMNVSFVFIGWALGKALFELLADTYSMDHVSIAGWVAVIAVLSADTNYRDQLLLFMIFVMWWSIEEGSLISSQEPRISQNTSHSPWNQTYYY